MRDLTSPDLPPSLGEPFSLLADSYRRLTGLVRGMSQEALEYPGPAGNRNSTAMLIAHLARTDVEYLYQIMGVELPPEMVAEFGPYETPDDTLPVVTGKSVEELLAHYGRVIEMVREYLKTQSEADATRPVQVPWWPGPASVRYVVWHMAAHSMIHQGQIARLKAWYKEQA